MFTDAGHATPPQLEEHQQEWLEAVEIKNVCPFREVREVASNGKAKRLYRLSDPGPYSRVSVSSHLPISYFSTGFVSSWQYVQNMNADDFYVHGSAWKMAFLLLLQLCNDQKLGHCDACVPLMCVTTSMSYKAHILHASLKCLHTIPQQAKSAASICGTQSGF